MFQFYNEERRIFEFVDYGALLDECRRVKPSRVLEFGPGASTLALVEAGVPEIHTCEHQDRWFGAAAEMLAPHPAVKLHRYINEAKVSVPTLPAGMFDLAFVDGPVGLEARSAPRFPGQENMSRWNTLAFALSRADIVLLHDAKREHEQNSLRELERIGYRVEMIDTPKGIARITTQPGSAA